MQILDAVHACHEKGVFHRDLKPDNIMCSDDGASVHLVDFGVATNIEISTRHACGTLSHNSPGKSQSQRSDQLALTPLPQNVWA